MPRQLVIRGHIAHVQNLIGQDGKPYCHVLLDGTAGDAAADQIKLTAKLVDTGDAPRSWKAAPAMIKRKDGSPLHEYLGVPLVRPAIKEEPIDPRPIDPVPARR